MDRPIIQLLKGHLVISIITVLIVIGVIAYVLASNFIHAAPTWTMVDCNAGGATQDCHILTDGEDIIIVDTGTVEATREYFIPYLKKLGVTEVDHFFVSHPHDNHVGGLIDIIRSGVRINNIYFNDPVSGHNDFAYSEAWWSAIKSEALSLGAKLHPVNKGDIIKTANTKMVILEAPKTRQVEINDYSIIMRWEAGGYSTLFSGDLSVNLGKKLAGNPIFSADFYKAPHHGVTPIAPNNFSDTVNPVLTLVPQPKKLERHARGLPFFYWAKNKWQSQGMIRCTNGLNGHVKIVYQKINVLIQPQHEYGSCIKQTLYVNAKSLVNQPPVKNAFVIPLIEMLL